MIEALINGRMHGQAEQRVAVSGRPFVTARVKAAIGEGESILVSVVAFSESAGAALLALEDGDSLSVAGELKPKAWIDRDGQARPGADLVGRVVLSPYHARRKRAAMQPKGKVAHAAAADDDSDCVA